MSCPNCGDESGENYCTLCGAAIDQSESPATKPGIGAGGAVVLFMTLLVMVSYFISSSNGISFRLPSWLKADSGNPESTSGITTNLNVPPVETPAVKPADPYEELVSTRIQLSEYSIKDIRIRLNPNNSAQDIDSLMRSKIKALRHDSDVVRLRIYSAGSDALEGDQPAVSYIAVSLLDTPYPDPRNNTNGKVDEIEPGIFKITPQ